MPLPVFSCLLASGLFLLAGLMTGVWKYIQMTRRPDHRAFVYVDVAHRASLLYSFASLVMASLVHFSPYSVAVQMGAVGVPLFFFAAAVLTYVWLGVTERTDNQFRERNFLTTWGMVLLAVGEIGGVAVLVWGFWVSQTAR